MTIEKYTESYMKGIPVFVLHVLLIRPTWGTFRIVLLGSMPSRHFVGVHYLLNSMESSLRLICLQQHETAGDISLSTVIKQLVIYALRHWNLVQLFAELCETRTRSKNKKKYQHTV